MTADTVDSPKGMLLLHKLLHGVDPVTISLRSGVPTDLLTVAVPSSDGLIDGS